MFFIKYKDNIFKNKDNLTSKEILKQAGPFNASSWGNDLTTQNNYILNAFRKRCSEKSTGSLSSSECSQTSLKSKRSKRNAKKYFYTKKILEYTEDYTKKTNGAGRDELTEQLSEANKKIDELLSEKECIDKRANEAEEEVANLRQLLKDCGEQLDLLKRLKDENISLRFQLDNNANEKLKEAEDEINALSSQLEIYKNVKIECADIKQSYNKLKEDYGKLNLEYLEFRNTNETLKKELESYKKTANHHLCRELYASNAIVDREALRARINHKDEKINLLVSFLEEQEMTIHDLAAQLDRLTRGVAEKESIISKQMDNLKLSLQEKTSRIILLEDQLHTSELLIRELENVREHFRLANASLNQNMICYKTQFKSVVSCSERLLTVKGEYEKDLGQKEETIKKMSKFAQSPKSIVYLAQILHVLKRSEDSINDESDSVFSFVPTVRRIVEKMKEELWRDCPLVGLVDKQVHVGVQSKDSCTQNQAFFCSEHKYAEADLPDRLHFQHENLKNKYSETIKNMSTLEEAYYKKDELNRDLERKLNNAFEQIVCKEKELSDTQKELELVQEKLLALKGELEYSDSLLSRALVEIEAGQEAFDSTSDLLSVSLDKSLAEYTRYVDMMEQFVLRKEEQVESIQNYVRYEICQKAQFENDYIFRLENEIKRMADNYTKKKQAVQHLTAEIETLKSELLNKCSTLRKIEDNFIRTLGKLEETNADEFRSKEDLGKDEVLIDMSEKILRRNENLDQLYKEERRLNEVMRRETYSKDYVRKLTKDQQKKYQKLRKKVKLLRRNMRKVKRLLWNTKRGMSQSDKDVELYKNNINSLVSKCEKYREIERLIRKELNEKVQIIENMKCIIKTKEMDFDTLICEKDKMEKVLLKIIKNLETSLSGVCKESVGTVTEVDGLECPEISDLTTRNNELSTVIVELQERLNNLLYVPQREKCSNNSVYVQVDTKEEFNKLVENYESTIRNLKEEHANEKEAMHARNINNMDAFKDMYIRDLKSIFNNCQKTLEQLHQDYSEEISRLKSLHEENSKHLVDKFEVQKFHEVQLENQRLYYENLLGGKDCELNNEIKELRVDIQNIISKKEEVINKMKESAMLYYNKLSDLKKRFKKQMNKLRMKYEKKTKENEKMNELLANMKVEKVEANCQTQLNKDESKGAEIEVCETSCQTVSYNDTKDECVQCILPTCGTTVGTVTDCGGMVNEGTQPNDKPAKGKRNHVVFGLPPNKNIGINYKESIKCSIQESQAVGDFLYDLPQSCGGASIRDIAILKDKNQLINRIEELENELLHKTEGFNRNVSMYQETIKRHVTKISELENSLNQECMLTCGLQHRLGQEFNNAEQLRAERNNLQKRLDQLEAVVQDREQETYTEREKYKHLKKHFDDIMCQRKASDQLEVTLKRLKEKLETAVEYEKKLTKEIQEDRRTEERIKDIIVSNNSERDIRAEEEDQNREKAVTQENVRDQDIQESPDLKVVFIQQCEFRHTWSRQVFETNP